MTSPRPEFKGGFSCVVSVVEDTPNHVETSYPGKGELGERMMSETVRGSFLGCGAKEIRAEGSSEEREASLTS